MSKNVKDVGKTPQERLFVTSWYIQHIPRYVTKLRDEMNAFVNYKKTVKEFFENYAPCIRIGTEMQEDVKANIQRVLGTSNFRIVYDKNLKCITGEETVEEPGEWKMDDGVEEDDGSAAVDEEDEKTADDVEYEKRRKTILSLEYYTALFSNKHFPRGMFSETSTFTQLQHLWPEPKAEAVAADTDTTAD